MPRWLERRARRRHGRTLLLATLAVVLGWASVAAGHPLRVGRYAELPYGISRDHPHPADRGGPQRRGRSEGLVLRSEPHRRWDIQLPHRRPRGPVLDSRGMLYVSTSGGLAAFDPRGALQWFFPTPGIQEAPALDPAGDIVFTARTGEVVIVDAAGRLRRRTSLGVMLLGGPLVLDDGSIFVVTVEPALVHLDASLARLSGHSLTDEARSGTLARAPDGSMTLGGGRQLLTFGPSGEPRRSENVASVAHAPVAIDDEGTRHVATADGTLLVMDATGALIRRVALGGPVSDAATLALASDGSVRVPTLRDGLVCIDREGAERWRFESDVGFHAPAMVDRVGTTLAVDRGGRMIALDANGELLWQVALGSFTYQAPVIGADGTIYVVTERGRLSAWSASGVVERDRAPGAHPGEGDSGDVLHRREPAEHDEPGG